MKSIDTLLLFVWHSCHSCIAQNIEEKKEYFQKLSLYKNIFDTIVFTQRKHLNLICYLLKSNCPPFLIINERHSAFKFSHWCHLPTSWVVNASVLQHRASLYWYHTTALVAQEIVTKINLTQTKQKDKTIITT